MQLAPFLGAGQLSLIHLTSHILVIILANYTVIILTVDSRMEGVMRMLKNMGNMDRFIRVVIGIAAIILALLVRRNSTDAFMLS